MKTAALIITAFISVATSMATELTPAVAGKLLMEPMTLSIQWPETTFNFGMVKQGLPVEHEFIFTNDGDGPLTIASVKASCGCTVTDYSQSIVAPGERGFVRVTYNAATIGSFTKTVTVVADTGENATVLTIRGEVIE